MPPIPRIDIHEPARKLARDLDHAWGRFSAVANSRPFISQTSLDNLVSLSVVEEIVSDLAQKFDFLPERSLSETIRDIHLNYKRVLAILVMIHREQYIVWFVERASGDDKLPFDKAALDNVDPHEELSGSTFLQKQHFFLAPKFVRHMEQEWSEECVLPLIREDDIKSGRGGFGKVYKIKIHPEFDQLQDENYPAPTGSSRNTYARKTLTNNDQQQLAEEYGLEVEAGKRLRGPNNPNIVPLLANYKYGNTFNLIFPYADGGNLRDFFEKDQPPRNPVERLRFLEQIARLASALSTIHNCVDKDARRAERDGKRYGVHRDIKPQNILKRGDSFLLADFGLTRFKRQGPRPSSNQSYGFQWKYGLSTYRAPECELKQEGTRVGQKADIWSLGCVFADVLTFTVKGYDGIMQFVAKREAQTEIPNCYSDYFHDRKKVTPAVLDWLTSLESFDLDGSSLVRDFVTLLKDMLQEEPKNRPVAEAVALRLYKALRTEADRIESPLKLEEPSKEYNDSSVVERKRSYKLKRAHSAIESSPFEAPSLYKFDSCPPSLLCRPAKNRRAERHMDGKFADGRIPVAVPTIYHKTEPENPLAILDEMDTMFLIDDNTDPRLWEKIRVSLAEFAKHGTEHDRDGVDLAFVRSKTQIKSLDSPEAVMKEFEDYLNKLNPDDPPMPIWKRISDILNEYMAKYQRDFTKYMSTSPLNLIVVTDGVMEQEDWEKLVEVIMEHASMLDKNGAEKYQLGVQFVLVGSDQKAKDRFNDLDEEEYKRQGVRDMVDHVDYNPDKDASKQLKVLYKVMCGGVHREWDSNHVSGSAPMSPT